MLVTLQSGKTVNADMVIMAIGVRPENVLAKQGTSFVEVVSTCNSGWKMTPVGANEWMEANMIPYYPLGDLKDSVKGEPVSDN